MEEEGLLTCSAFNVSSIKICCNFSLTKLIQNCSKPFFWKKKKKVLALIVYAKSFKSFFLSDLLWCFNVESLNRKVGGFSRKLHSLYSGETHLVQENLTWAKTGLWWVFWLPRIISSSQMKCITLPVSNYSNSSYLEYFKAIDVQDSNVVFFMVLLHRFVDGLGESNRHGN